MADYAEKLREDLIEQFKGKPVIDALVTAVGEQLNDVYQFFSALNTRRGIQTAEGKQLDGVGDIVCMSRMDAGELACISEPVYLLEDELYRRFLFYKVWKNTNNCTYDEIVKAFKMFWDKPLYYREVSEVPATMMFETDDLTPGDDAQKLLTAPFVKAAGVAIKVKAITVSPEMSATQGVSAMMGRGLSITVLPELPQGEPLEDAVRIVPTAHNITHTILPEMEVSE